MEEQKPSVGRIVHYVAYGTPKGEFPAGICRAATITEVYFGQGSEIPPGVTLQIRENGVCYSVGLCVQNPTGLFFNRGIKYDENKAPGTWHWPERV